MKKSNDYEQIVLSDILSKEFLKTEEESIAHEIFQDPTPFDEIQKGKYISNPLPEEVSKTRSQLMDNVIALTDTCEEKVVVENNEIIDFSEEKIITTLTLQFERENTPSSSETASDARCSRILTCFDREVIDAVSTLAPFTQIMTSALIYNTIVGRAANHTVTAVQRKKVDESMLRCSRCEIIIDVTAEVEKKRKTNGAWKTWERAISYKAIEHKAARGVTVYYQILAMPPFYKYAESISKISKIPLRLINSPVVKTDSIIAAQSYLLREIEYRKKNNNGYHDFCWSDIYDICKMEGKEVDRQENNRTRKNISKILQYWIKEKFIVDFESFPRKNLLTITFQEKSSPSN